MSTEPDDVDSIALYTIEQIVDGSTLAEIGEALGIKPGALYMRCTATAELARRYWMAKETSAEPLESEMMKVARETALVDPKAARVQIAALQWVLSRRNPKRYGEHLALDHSSSDGSMSPKEAVDMSKLSDTALSELMAARKPKERDA